MKLPEYLRHDATGLAALVARGEVSALELLELALHQHARTQGRTNALCRLMEAQARAQIAHGLSGPLAGVPFLLKDLLQDYAGVPTTFGSRALTGTVPSAHAAIVRRYLGAGLVIFGKTNLPEFGLKAVSDSALFGRTANPWDTARTPGGSSGGAAAAVASGVVPMAAGNDGGGSIRIPAACCGLFGLRPSRGRVSLAPAMGEAWFGATSEGVISRSVRDSAHALDILQGPESGDPFVIAPPGEPYGQTHRREPGRLRIGFTTRSPIGTAVHAEAVAAVHDAAHLLQSLGHVVVEAAPQLDGAALAQGFLHVYFGTVSAIVQDLRGRGVRRDRFELLTRVLAALGDAISAGTLTTHLQRMNDHARALGRFHEQYDLLLTPTLAAPPILHGTGDPAPGLRVALDLLERTGLLTRFARAGLLDSTVAALARENLQYVPFTQLANLTGTPAMSVPLHWTADGLPLGVQFVARFGAEDMLLQLAHQLEQARPWFKRQPAWVVEAASAPS